MDLSKLSVDGHATKWYIVWPDGSAYDGPYKRAQDAKAQLTMLKRSK